MRFCLLILLLTFSIMANAEVHRWVDENNHIHYSDQPPPPSTNAKKLRSTSSSNEAAESGPSTGKDTPAAPKTIAEREAELKKTQQAKKEAADKDAKKQADEEATKAYCATAQQNLRALQEGIRVIEFDAKGERSYIDDEQRKQRIAKTQEEISKRCK